MECLTELTCSVFADGELPDEESREVEEHLKSCSSCRTMAEAFREESQLLAHCFQEIDILESAHASQPVTAPALSASPVAPPVRPKDLAKFGGLLVGLSALIRLATSSPENFVLPSIPGSLDWLDPSDLSGKLNWLVGATVFVAGEGVSRMMSIVNSLSVVVMYLLLLAGLVVLVRKSSKSAIVAALGALLLMVAGTSPTYAMEVRNGGQDRQMTIAASEVIDDSLFVTGDRVTIDGTITGDLIAFARQVTIHGTVNGNVITAGQSVNVDGTVGGSIISAGQAIQINGKVMHNAVGFTQSFILGKDSSVGGDAGTFGNDSHLNGTIAHNLYAFGIAEIAGSIGRSVVFRGATISVLPSARIGGDLTSYVPRAETVHVDPGAMISGKQTVELTKDTSPNPYFTFKYYFSELLHVVAAFIFGMIVFMLFPGLRRLSFNDVASTLIAGGIGFLGVIAMPIAALIVCITLIGIPVAIVGFISWLLGIYLAKILIANFVGRTLFKTDSDRMSSLALNLIVGLVLVFIVINIPFIGGLLHFLLVIIGFGALVTNVYRSYQAADSGR